MNKEAMKPVECHTCKGLGRIYMGCGSWIHCDTCNTTGKATTQPKREPPCKTGSQCTTKCMECAEPEPVAVVSGYYGGKCVVLPTDPARIFNSGTAFYTHPPKREPLTDEQMEQIHQQYGGNIKKIMRAVEAAHDIKGEA